ncbi:magnesium ion transporter [Marasmius tenuissimus]|nr:magnesium ion transporter [Marasmius tenuissimus]
MYLSDKKASIHRDLHDHKDLEVLLETFSKQVEEIVNEVANLESNVQSTQEIVELIIDSNRNALLALDLQVSIATFGVGTGALLAGVFGMNLQNHLEDHPFAFFGMTFLCGALAFLASYTCFRKLSQIRNIGLSRNAGGSSQKPRKAWRLPLPLRRRSGDGWS